MADPNANHCRRHMEVFNSICLAQSVWRCSLANYSHNFEKYFILYHRDVKCIQTLDMAVNCMAVTAADWHLARFSVIKSPLTVRVNKTVVLFKKMDLVLSIGAPCSSSLFLFKKRNMHERES